MKRKMLLSLNNHIETNEFYALTMLLDPMLKFSSSALIQARQCLTKELILFLSAIAEVAAQNNDPPVTKR